MTTAATTGSLMERLKAETAEHHARAEGKALMRELVQGQISRERYSAWLGQMLLIHDALEKGLAKAPAHPLVALARRCPSHAANLRQDLKTFQQPETPKPSNSTRRLSDAINGAAADPAAIFGMLYVLEGSMNGNKYIAMGLRKGLGLAPGTGDKYLDPYGDQQRPMWARFKAEAEAVGAAGPEVDRAVAAAKTMFDGIADVCEELVG